MRTSFLLLLLATAALATGCDSEQPGDSTGAKTKDRIKGVTYDEHGEPAGLHRYIRWSKNVGQGAGPMGEVAFKNLKALGYRTVLSVDGSIPEVELAKKHGLRYVHVPIGYDGIPKEQALQIVKAGRISPFPVYVHCHHGRHRGPAAAMLLRISEDKVPNDEAVKGLERSETSPKYKGLWKTVRDFRVPSDKELAAVKELPSKVLPKGLRAGMVDVSHRFEGLKVSNKAGWKVSKEHPDIDPPHEARMLWELFRELGRTDKECRDQGEVFLKYLKASEDATIELEKAIRAGDVKSAKRQFTAVKNLCSDCHTNYRN